MSRQKELEEDDAEVEVQQLEDDDGRTQPVAKLMAQANLTAKDCRCLEAAGFCTVESIAFAPKKALLAIKGTWKLIFA
jgi:hypothetical protein